MDQNTRAREEKQVLECLFCSEEINIKGNPKIGVMVECSNCESLFEIVEVNPVSIDWPYYGDDFIDDDDFFDFDD